MMSNPRHNCSLSARTPHETCAQSSSSFLANKSFSLVVISSRRLRVCLCRSRLPLVSVHTWNLMRHVLWLDNTICSAYMSDLYDRRSIQVKAVLVNGLTIVAANLPVVAVAWASSIGISTRHNHRLNRWHNRRHSSLANNRINDYISDNRPMDRLPPRRHLLTQNLVPLRTPRVVAVARGNEG